MKLLNLDLLAYGPFTGKQLDFDNGSSDFHVIFGGNEAGKSSALRALIGLLYGVPVRTTDTFLHEAKTLRIGGCVRHSDGTELLFVRRKGSKNTLLDADEGAIDAGALGPFLAGVDRVRFETVFGIDHERLARGAQAILSGGGDVGESLFSVGLGTANLRKVLAELDAEADELYKSRGSKPTINRGLAAYKNSAKSLRELTLLSSNWAQKRKQLQALQTQQQAIADEQRALETRETRLGRLQKILPKLAGRKDLLDQLKPLADVVLLGLDFTERRRDAEQTLRHGQKTCDDAEDERTAVLDRIDAINVPQELLDEHAPVNGLYKDLGSFRKAEADATKLEARRAQSRADAHALLDGLRPEVPLDEVDGMRPKTGTKARVRELAEKFQAIDAAPAHTVRDVKRCERAVHDARDLFNGLDDPREVAPLRAVVTRLRKRGDVEAAHQSAIAALSAARKEADVALRALGLWDGTLDEAEKLAAPTLQSIDRFDEGFRAVGKALSDNETALLKCRENLADQQERLTELRISGDVVTEADLDVARAHRTQGWLMVRSAWLGEDQGAALTGEFDAADDLPSAYQGSVEEADEVADRLRREAERVARFAAIEARQSRLVEELKQLQSSEGTATERAAAEQAAWVALWAPLGIQPLPPREMRAWLGRHDGTLGRARDVRAADGEVERLERDIAALRTALSTALAALGEKALAAAETLEEGLDRSQVVIDSATGSAKQRDDLAARAPDLGSALEEARDIENEAVKALAGWQGEWADAITDLGLGATASPAEANAVLDKLEELFKKVDEARIFTSRLKGIERDAQTFKDRVAQLVQSAAPDLLARPTGQAVDMLHERLAAAKADAATLVELKQLVEKLSTAIASGERAKNQAAQDLQALCSEAGCAQASELAEAERLAGEKRARSQELGALENQITEFGGGKAVKALVAEAEGIDSDTLPAEIEELRRERAALDEHRTQLDQQIGSERSEFGRLDGSGKAADEAAVKQGELAKLATNVERYVRVRLAAVLLRREIERYREANQGPLLRRAGHIFAALTLGSFSNLRADYDEKDVPVLVGVRPDGERVGVHGMSDGTADQLYLAIRLATLEQHLASQEPMPFVVDDILIHFDDERASAALEVLADIAEKTQVLFFTHHARLVELAGKLGAGRVQVHNL